MKYSIAFASEVDSWRWVKRAEALGFHAAWFYDTQLLNPDVFVCMALAAHETSSIRLGTGVLVPSNRIEPVTANAFASLNQIAPGRIDFGVGTGFTARRTMGLGAISLSKTRRYINRVQALLRGETLEWDFENESRKIRFLNPDLGLINLTDDIPLWFSAFGPKAMALAAELNAGWLNFGINGAEEAIGGMQAVWGDAGRNRSSLQANLFVLGAVLSGDSQQDEAKLMAEAAPLTAVMFHNLADEVGAMGGRNLPTGPLSNLLSEYLTIHDRYQPVDAKYLNNHRGHLMFVRPEETHITPELVRNTTLSGTPAELVERLRRLKAAGYTEITIQLVHDHEDAIDAWADVLSQV